MKASSPSSARAEGFVGYYLAAGGRHASRDQSCSKLPTKRPLPSDETARDFVADYLTPLLPNAPLIVEGTVEVSTTDDVFPG